MKRSSSQRETTQTSKRLLQRAADADSLAAPFWMHRRWVTAALVRDYIAQSDICVFNNPYRLADHSSPGLAVVPYRARPPHQDIARTFSSMEIEVD